MKSWKLLILLVGVAVAGCNGHKREFPNASFDPECSTPLPTTPDLIFPPMNGALLATRFCTLKDLQTMVSIEYAPDTSHSDTTTTSSVRLIHQSNGQMVTSLLESGVSQDDLVKVQEGGVWGRLMMMFRLPYAVANRADLQRVLTLSRRVPLSFGEGDPAFFDLAETSVANINTADLAFQFAEDTTEKGYINSFNHITAQAFIASIFSEEMADFAADLHERKNMLELTTGKFTPDQLENPENNPVDNYVDMINNEWGQELGKWLRAKYHIHRGTWWTPELLADYLNDIQGYYSWAFQIGFKPYTPEDELVRRFSAKLNVVMDVQEG
jgi:hypothetical protein